MEALAIVWGLLKKLWPFLLLGIALAGAAYWYHDKLNDARDEGAASVQKKWDADKEARVAMASGLALLYAHQVQLNEQQEAKHAEEMRDAKAKFDARLKNLPTERTIYIGPDTYSVLHDLTQFANGASAASAASAAPAGGAPAIPFTAGSAPAGYISEQDHAAFVSEAAAAYRVAVEMFHDVRKRYLDAASAQQQVLKGELP